MAEQACSLQDVIEKLESLFSKFNDQYYDSGLEKPVITVSPDTAHKVLRYFGWCTSWKAWKRGDSEGFYEINICAEHLNRPFADICNTLLHEMVHLFNLQQGVKDTSRSGTYYNKRFRVAAEEHGLIVECDEKYGYYKTVLSDVVQQYVSSFDGQVFDMFRVSALKKKSKSSCRKYICPGCRAIIRATKQVNIICADCDLPFEEEER